MRRNKSKVHSGERDSKLQASCWFRLGNGNYFGNNLNICTKLIIRLENFRLNEIRKRTVSDLLHIRVKATSWKLFLLRESSSGEAAGKLQIKFNWITSSDVNHKSNLHFNEISILFRSNGNCIGHSTIQALLCTTPQFTSHIQQSNEIKFAICN